MRKPRFVLVAVLILVILICECAAKSSVKKPKGKSHHKNDGKHVLKSTVKGKKNGYKNETKRQFINRPRIRYFGNRPYIWMKPAPLTQRTIVTTHIPRPPLALPYSSRIMQLLANKYPSLYARQMVPQGYPGYGGVSQGSMFGPGLHPDSFMGGGSPLEDEDSDEHCEPNPCQNGGTCNEIKEGYECICSSGFKGSDCEEENHCHPNPCRNAGVCTEADGAFVCTCSEGFKGVNCEEHNKCQPNPCKNGGSCTEINGGFECSCGAEYRGPTCEEIDHCHLSPCMNGGTCMGGEGPGMTTCLCPSGYTGTHCELESRCHTNPCRNGGTCLDSQGAFQCLCPQGFTGVSIIKQTRIAAILTHVIMEGSVYHETVITSVIVLQNGWDITVKSPHSTTWPASQVDHVQQPDGAAAPMEKHPPKDPHNWAVQNVFEKDQRYRNPKCLKKSNHCGF